MHYRSRKYTRLVEWIAMNDNPGDNEAIEHVAGYLTVTMLAHCYDLNALDVAHDVLAVRAPSAATDEVKA